MFDANARYLPDGKLFFAECHGVNPKNKVMTDLLRKGENYLCRKMGEDPNKCQFIIYLDNSRKGWYLFDMDFDNEDDFDFYSLFVYSGCPDGTGFISEEWKQKALDFLGGEWYE